MEEKQTWILSAALATLLVGCLMYFILAASAPMLSVQPPAASAPRASSDPSPTNEPTAPRAQEPSKTGQIYRCKKDGTTIYSDAPCPGAKVVDVQVTEGVRLVRPGERPSSPAVAQSVPRQLVVVSSPVASEDAGQCALLADALKRIDDQARQLHPAATQDRLREDRRTVLQRMSQLSC